MANDAEGSVLIESRRRKRGLGPRRPSTQYMGVVSMHRLVDELT